MKNCVFEKKSRIITNTFKISSYICNAKTLMMLIIPSSTRIDAQYEIGLFLCPSVNHIVQMSEMVPYTKFVDVAICDKCIRLSFPNFIARKGCIVSVLANREMAAVLASCWVQENLPKMPKY